MTTPPPTDEFTTEMPDGTGIVVRRHGNPGGPRLVLSHGNGLACDGYSVFWSGLLDGFDIVLFDFRGHGRNAPSRPENHDWETFAHDMDRVGECIVERYGRKSSVGVFHSMAAISAVMHDAAHGCRFDALILFEPPIFPPETHRLRARHFASNAEIIARTERRAETFVKPEDLARQFRRHAAREWHGSACEDMARATLRRDAAGASWRLVCARDLEARIYLGTRTLDLWDAVGGLTVPVAFVHGDSGDDTAQTTALISRALADEHELEAIEVRGGTHFLQVERPQACRAAVRALVAKLLS